MANVKFQIDPKAQNPFIVVRLWQGKKFDVKRKTHIQINRDHWNPAKQRLRSLTGINREQVNDYLMELEVYLHNQFNQSYAEGLPINGEWLQAQLNAFNKQPGEDQGTDDPTTFFVPFAENFIESLKGKVNKRTGKLRSQRTIDGYYLCLGKIKEFQEHKNIHLQLKQIDAQFEQQFTSFLQEQAYSSNYIGRLLPGVKSIALGARAQGLDTHPSLTDILCGFTEDLPVLYLDNDELDSIYNLDMEPGSQLDVCRDWMVIGALVGQRSSDLLKLTKANIKDDDIILKQQKTGKRVYIPIAPRVRFMLTKYGWEFPPSLSPQEFNKRIKEVCQLAKINQMVQGAIYDPELKRKVKGEYPKWRLMSSHTLRRSFCSNFYSVWPTPWIRMISGHGSEYELLRYIGRDSQDFGPDIKNFWNADKEQQTFKIHRKQG